MSKLEELKERAKQIRASKSHWASCQDGSYEMALAESGYYRLLIEIADVEKEINGETMNEDKLRAYALGYYHGKAEGEGLEDCPYEEGELRHLYKRGYDAGIADYCEELK